MRNFRTKRMSINHKADLLALPKLLDEEKEKERIRSIEERKSKENADIQKHRALIRELKKEDLAK